MANYLVTDTQLTSVANAIRAKTGNSSGLSFPDGMISAVGNISTGSGTTDGDVIFIDYDGTIVTSKSKAEINAMTSDSDLPANPTHTGLTSQGWNWTVAQLKAQLTAMPDQNVYVGQMYVTASGATEIDVEMIEGRLSPIMSIAVNGTISVDWGDNTTPDTVTGTSLSTRLAVGPHNYASPGSYTIKISVSTGKFSFNCSSTYGLLRKNTIANQNRIYANCVKRIRLGTGIEKIDASAFYYCCSLLNITIPNSVTSIGNYAFYYCHSLSNIVIPNTVTSIGTGAFGYCYSLSNITIPNTVTSIGNYMFTDCSSLSNIVIPHIVINIGNNVFNNCYSLSNIMMPSGVTSIEDSAFYHCYALSSITIPSGVTIIGANAFYYCYTLLNITIPNTVTSIGATAFYNCYSLSKVTIPNSVTSIENSAFAGCCGVVEYHILSETVPTLGTTVFSSMSSDCIIYVPYSADHSILNAYQTATNWSTYASQIQEEPQ